MYIDSTGFRFEGLGSRVGVQCIPGTQMGCHKILIELHGPCREGFRVQSSGCRMENGVLITKPPS